MPKTFCVIGHDARQQAAARVLRRAGYGVTAADTVSYTHLTLPTKRVVEDSVGAVALKKKKKDTGWGEWRGTKSTTSYCMIVRTRQGR